MEMSVYIVNLGKYRDGTPVGAWFTPPIDYEDMKEKLGPDAEWNYIIRHYDLPFDIEEDTKIEELNYLCGLVNELEGTPLYDALPDLLSSGYFGDIRELVSRQDDIRYWYDCTCLADVAYDSVHEGYFGEVPEYLQMFINHDRLGWAIGVNGIFVCTSKGVFEIL